MSDSLPDHPPPPPPGAQPAPPPPPVYQGPPPPAYVQQYMQSQQPAAPPPAPPQYGQPPYAQPQTTMAGAAAIGAGSILYQLGGPAGWSIAFGLVSIVFPFVTNIYFPIMPIFGALNAIRAIQRGRLIGGVIGLGVNIIGGLVSLIASGLIGG